MNPRGAITNGPWPTSRHTSRMGSSSSKARKESDAKAYVTPPAPDETSSAFGEERLDASPRLRRRRLRRAREASTARARRCRRRRATTPSTCSRRRGTPTAPNAKRGGTSASRPRRPRSTSRIFARASRRARARRRGTNVPCHWRRENLCRSSRNESGGSRDAATPAQPAVRARRQPPRPVPRDGLRRRGGGGRARGGEQRRRRRAHGAPRGEGGRVKQLRN